MFCLLVEKFKSFFIFYNIPHLPNKPMQPVQLIVELENVDTVNATDEKTFLANHSSVRLLLALIFPLLLFPATYSVAS